MYMHKLDVIILGPKNFFLTLNELSTHLKFNLYPITDNFDKKTFTDEKILLCHEEFIQNKKNLKFLKDIKCTKILASIKHTTSEKVFNDFIKLPTSVKQLNDQIETSSAKKIFGINSSIKIKDYTLDKNEKKLNRNGKSLILTEKEIQLLELFLENSNPISKKKILSKVWHYSSSADTHTVETHIYRLRKKIIEIFSDESFILNSKDGYYL